MHIGDFCVPAVTIEVRCAAHPPAEGTWTRFGGVHEYGPRSVGRGEELGDWYVRYTGDPVELERAHLKLRGQSLLFFSTEDGKQWPVPPHYLRALSPGPVYGIGFAGDIIPNCGWDTEEVITFGDGEPQVLSRKSMDELEAERTAEVDALVRVLQAAYPDEPEESE